MHLKNRDPYEAYEFVKNHYNIVTKVFVWDGFNPMKSTGYLTYKLIEVYTIHGKALSISVEGMLGEKEVDYLVNRFILAVNRIEDLFYDLAVKEIVKQVLKRFKDAVLMGIHSHKIGRKMYVYVYFRHKGEVYWARFPYEYIKERFDDLRNLMVVEKEIRNVLFHEDQIHINT